MISNFLFTTEKKKNKNSSVHVRNPITRDLIPRNMHVKNTLSHLPYPFMGGNLKSLYCNFLRFLYVTLCVFFDIKKFRQQQFTTPLRFLGKLVQNIIKLVIENHNTVYKNRKGR